MNSDTAIKVTNLSKVYTLRHPRTDENGVETNEHWALKDVSFEIKKGESVGIIGPNGSGKSTLLKILAGVTKPTSGSVEIRGKVASILDIGAGFHPELSGRENVYLNGQIHGFSKKEIESKLDEIVTFSGIEKFIDEPVKNYSNGMYLRLAFSIMAHLDFDVYLFDEVLSVGDAEFQNKTQIKIQAILKRKKTVLYVGHDIPQMIDLCRRYVILYHGRISNAGDNNVLYDYVNNLNISENSELNFYNIKPLVEIEKIEDVVVIKNISIEAKRTLPKGIDSESDININFEIQLKKDTQIDVGIRWKDNIKGIVFSTSTVTSSYPMLRKGIYYVRFVVEKI